MPFESKDQWKAAFGGFLGPVMKSKASEWAHKTPSFKSLPDKVKKKSLKKIISNYKK